MVEQMRKTDGGLSSQCSRNTGAKATTTDASIDYLGISLKEHEVSKAQVQRILARDAGWLPCRALHGYSQARKTMNVTMHFGGNDNSTFFDIGGKGCRDLERIHGLKSWRDWADLLEDIFQTGARISRSDFAFDDKCGLISYERLLRKVRQRAVQSTFRIARRYEDIRLSDAKVVGKSLMFGSVKSDLLVRVYDKALQLSESDQQSNDEIWTRLEVQARKGYANLLTRSFSQLGYMGILGDLRTRLSFRVPSQTDSNKYRWKESPWWKKFLDSAPSHRMRLQNTISSSDDTALSLLTQYGDFMGQLQESEEGSKMLEWILQEAVTKHGLKALEEQKPGPKRNSGPQLHRELLASAFQRRYEEDLSCLMR